MKKIKAGPAILEKARQARTVQAKLKHMTLEEKLDLMRQLSERIELARIERDERALMLALDAMTAMRGGKP
jgi:hypothetical protein